MSKQSLYSLDKSVVFRETFNSELEVRKNHLTPANGVVIENGYADFSGNTSAILTSSNPIYLTDVTIRMVISDFTHPDGVQKSFFGNGNNSVILGPNTRIYTYKSASNNIAVIQQASNTPITVNSTAPYFEGQFVEIVFALDYDANTGGCWVNGVKLASQISNGVPFFLREFGNTTYPGLNNCGCKIHLFELYNRQLSETEIMLLYNKKIYLEPDPFSEGIKSLNCYVSGAYVDFGNNAGYALNGFEIETNITIYASLTRIISLQMNQSESVGLWVRSANTTDLQVITPSSTIETFTNSYVIGQPFKLNLKAYPISGTGLGSSSTWRFQWFINNSLLRQNDVAAITITMSGTDLKTALNFAYNQGGARGVNYRTFKLYSLNTSGVRTDTYMDLDFENINLDSSIVYNRAELAPNDGSLYIGTQSKHSVNVFNKYKEIFNISAKDGTIQDKYINAPFRQQVLNNEFRGWTAGDLNNWTEIAVSPGTREINQISDGVEFDIAGDGGTCYILQPNVFIVGHTYDCEVEIVSINDNALQIGEFSGSVQRFNFDSVGIHKFTFTATDDEIILRPQDVNTACVIHVRGVKVYSRLYNPNVFKVARVGKQNALVGHTGSGMFYNGYIYQGMVSYKYIFNIWVRVDETLFTSNNYNYYEIQDPATSNFILIYFLSASLGIFSINVTINGRSTATTWTKGEVVMVTTATNYDGNSGNIYLYINGRQVNSVSYASTTYGDMPLKAVFRARKSGFWYTALYKAQFFLDVFDDKIDSFIANLFNSDKNKYIG